MNNLQLTPAQLAADEAQQRVNECLNTSSSFRLEAGAGAGKTYSLVESLKILIGKNGTKLLQANQKIACITYTEVARDEISRKIEQHPAVLVETIHAFSWRFMGQFQDALRDLVNKIEDRKDKIEEGGGILNKRVEYSLGFFGVDDHKITLSHDDVPKFMSQLIALPKFQQLLVYQFPVIFIDEYQDTDKHIANAISEHFLAPNKGPLIGLFGDHWQTIYRGDYALVDYPNLVAIDKKANFRSVPPVVNVLNKLRQDLPQHVSDPNAVGEARFFHSNNYTGVRTNTNHSKMDLPPEEARRYAALVRNKLTFEGWDFSPEKTKVLMLTHNALATEQGYPTIASIFDRNEAFAKKEDPAIMFFADTLEPMYSSYEAGNYGEMFRLLGSAPGIRAHSDKLKWQEGMDKLKALRLGGTIGDVIDFLKESQRPRLSDKLSDRDQDLYKLNGEVAPDEPTHLTRHRNLRSVRYVEVIELVKFLDGQTPFATKHSVKGAEFENVLVILGGGWNMYNWPQFFELLHTGNITEKNRKAFYRARNLFYVAISRPKKRLAVLATQTMSWTALNAASHLFGPDNVHSV